MGATASRSAPTTTVVPVYRYSNLVRAPHRTTVRKLYFSDLAWDLRVSPMSCDEDGLADSLAVSVSIDLTRHGFDSAVGTHITIEIVDATYEEHTVFHTESDPATMQDAQECWMVCLLVSRRELEASSCVFACLDTFSVRCTLKKIHQAPTSRWPRLLPNFSKSNAPAVLPQVAMAGSHTLTIGSVSKLRAALKDGESVYSTHFVVGGNTWYLKFCPCSYAKSTSSVELSRARKADETPTTTAEFSFELQGAVNLASQKMSHTFDRDNNYFYNYKLEEIAASPMAMDDDRLVIRCYLAVIMPEEIPIAVPTCTESVKTPLLSAMHA